jgi:hypothetical protein
VVLGAMADEKRKRETDGDDEKPNRHTHKKARKSKNVVAEAEEDEEQSIYNTEEYQNMREEFEKTYFYHAASGVIGRYTPKYGLQYFGLSHARELLDPLFRLKDPDTGRTRPFLGVWRRDPERRLYWRAQLVPPTSPAASDADVFPIPVVFAVKLPDNQMRAAAQIAAMEGAGVGFGAFKAKCIKGFEDLLDCACGSVPEHVQYLRRYCADIFQHPLRRPDVAVIIGGKMGVGKDTLVTLLMRVLGRSYSYNYTKMAQFFNTHADGFENKLIVRLEEAGGKELKTNSEELKARITAEFITVNPKNQAERDTSNFTRYFITTNEASVVNFGQQSGNKQRRFFFLQAGDKRGDWNEFFGWVYNETDGLSSPAGLEIIGDYLMNTINIPDDWAPRLLPANQFMEQLAEMERTLEERFLFDVWRGERTPFNQLFSTFKAFSAGEGADGQVMSANAFGRALSTFVMTKRLVAHVGPGNTREFSRAAPPN